jgi:hypothetical protein
VSLFHRHDFELVARTYAEPADIEIERFSPSMFGRLMRAMTGTTTLVWKCRDKSCDAVKVVEVVGKEVTGS